MVTCMGRADGNWFLGVVLDRLAIPSQACSILLHPCTAAQHSCKMPTMVLVCASCLHEARMFTRFKAPN